MRIVAGKFGRRRLEASPGQTTRPIPDFVKESLFERLQHHLDGAKVADVFAGTGTIGLEALSRGASRVLFVEKDPRAFELLKRNVAALRVESETLCWLNDVFRCSFRPRDAEEFVPCDFVFLDPPYKLVESLQPGSPLFKAVERIGRPEFTADGAVLMLRTPADARFALPECWHPWSVLPQVGFSSMEIHLLQKTSVAAAEPLAEETREAGPEEGQGRGDQPSAQADLQTTQE